MFNVENVAIQKALNAHKITELRQNIYERKNTIK